ncbi:hypothetical protein [Pedobacter namyangjuensis]|uniref:hypothetical protein n=1 Tax=Pedobacter namyangjuensis TaxID=600626 RepID=UPI000DE360A4|nr:hypothetical protein [Pedobacter namyangjuensis]
MKKFCLVFSVVVMLIQISATAQKPNTLVEKIATYNSLLPTEKIYISTDKPYYNVGDTLWFKSILLNGNLGVNSKTDKIYVELFNDSLMMVERRSIMLNNGLGYGDFALSAKLKEGSYLLRAYSNWQQNFGSDYFFQKSFYIGNAGEKTWLLDAHQKLNTAGKKTLDLKVRITNLKNEVAGLKDVEIVLMNDKKKLMKADLQTSLQGLIETQIPLGENNINGNYSLIITDKKDRSRQSVLPISLQEVDEVDLQFMPEGGYMVNGIFGKVAFKAIGADGLGKNISGRIVDSKNETRAELNVGHKGMGNFFLLPVKGETYTAIYNLNGTEHKQTLPATKDEGTTLRIDHLSKRDSLYIYLKASESKRLNGYELFAQSSGETILNVKINLTQGFRTLKLPKLDFPDGIIHFTLFSPDGSPVNERHVFINRKQWMYLKVEANNTNFKTRDSISLNLKALTEAGLPASGSFSISVTDDSQVKVDNESNIASYFLLQSDLKGNVENPSWYFKDEDASTLLALDNLLLTQAWVGYNWNTTLTDKPSPKFKAEKGNEINGRLTNLLKNPVPNINLTLMSLGKTIFLTDTISNSDGYFKFKDIPFIDSAAYTIKIKNQKGKTSLATINVDEFTPASKITFLSQIKPWYINTDTSMLNYYKNKEIQKKPIDASKIKLEGERLKEVVIKGQVRQKEIMQTHAWDVTFLKKITEEELKKIPKKTLLTLLYEKIEGFTIGNFYADGCFGTEPREVNGVEFPPAMRPRKHEFSNFMVGAKLISHVFIDKVNTHILTQWGHDYYNENPFNVSRTAMEPEVFFINQSIFNILTAQDIVDINVYRGCNSVFLDIKTRSGKGPWVITTPGVYVHRPQPIYFPKEFYSPKYMLANKNQPDYRSTIFWDANIVTDENGKAKISFYAADKPSTYTVKIEGTDLNGRFGFKSTTISILNPPQPE